jgi:undecaprenyl-diphosphatase
MTFGESCILSVVEGLTEYLPISSTGHIMLASAILKIPEDDFVKSFTVMVQFGAIFAVFVEYFRILTRQWKMYPILFAAFLPAAVIGLALNKMIERALGSIWVVGVTLFVGGIALLFTDKLFPDQRQTKTDVKKMSYREAVIIGFYQCIALLPGVSRSAATIWGGLSLKFDKKTATEFSFLLAFPTLTAATLYKGYKGFSNFTPDQWQMLLWGNVISFIVGWISIRGFIHYVSKHGLKAFGYYRIAVGLVTLGFCYLGMVS